MPHKRKSPDDNPKPKRTYRCDCNERCGGVDHEVSKSTYHEHAPFRKKPMLEAKQRGVENTSGAGSSCRVASLSSASQDEEKHIPHDEQGTPPPGEEEHEEEPLPFLDNDDDFCPPSPPASPRPPNAHPVEEEEEEEEEPPYGWYEETGAPREALLEDLCKQQTFINAMKDTQLDKCDLDDNALNRLRNPQRKFPKLRKMQRHCSCADLGDLGQVG
ncbi:hypothetical protein OH76DRAFT_1477210 [Lentinus brumalis]|uniref:Uncharacterized protein n=1 Tax=Lentinus brumalis TaxID=2498619 RepID=A0A371DVT2_9APHY|nr:hypothetical protein OH76DRAFT_1477210 [Polyporus brumalis]